MNEIIRNLKVFFYYLTHYSFILNDSVYLVFDTQKKTYEWKKFYFILDIIKLKQFIENWMKTFFFKLFNLIYW